jgi:hypothetical protein
MGAKLKPAAALGLNRRRRPASRQTAGSDRDLFPLSGKEIIPGARGFWITHSKCGRQVRDLSSASFFSRSRSEA